MIISLYVENKFNFLFQFSHHRTYRSLFPAISLCLRTCQTCYAALRAHNVAYAQYLLPLRRMKAKMH